MIVLSDRQVPLAVWVAQPAKKNVGSDTLLSSIGKSLIIIKKKTK